METKYCPKCVEVKPLTDFHKNAGRRDGVQCYCKVCWRRESATHERRSKRIERDLRVLYGITVEEYDFLFELQDGCCAICEQFLISLTAKRTVRKKQIAHVDHCHRTGLVRGLLCNECNSGLGKFRDRIELLSSAVRYLRENATVRIDDRSENDKLRGKDEPQVAGPQSSPRLLKDNHWLN